MIITSIFEEKLDKTLNNDEYFASVAIVKYRDKWLLGLSKSEDDRNGKWCFPGGGVTRGEDPLDAAARECWEETGIKCTAKGPILKTNKKGVAFVPCVKKIGTINYKPNPEFTTVSFFTEQEMKSLKLYFNVKNLIKRAKRHLNK